MASDLMKSDVLFERILAKAAQQQRPEFLGLSLLGLSMVVHGGPNRQF